MTANHPEDLVARLPVPVAWRVKRYGEIAGGVTAWSEWMLFQDTNLAGRWADPGNVVCEPLYSVDAVTSLVGKRDALRDLSELLNALSRGVSDVPWIDHDGYRDPPRWFPKIVEVKFRDGETRFGNRWDWDQNWQWARLEPDDGDIVAYRAVNGAAESAIRNRDETIAALRAELARSTRSEVEFTGVIKKNTPSRDASFVELVPPVLGVKYAIINFETKGRIELMNTTKDGSLPLGMTVTGKGALGTEAIRATQVRALASPHQEGTGT